MLAMVYMVGVLFVMTMVTGLIWLTLFAINQVWRSLARKDIDV